MTSLSEETYMVRQQKHAHPVARKLFEIAEAKQSNLVLSADLTDSKSLLEIADKIGPYIAVLKTHVDLVADFNDETIEGLIALKEKHNFIIFEDRKLVDIGNTVQNILGGDGIVEALAQTVAAPDFPYPNERGFLILAEMTSKGSLAVGSYTDKCIELARKHTDAVVGFVATRALTDDLPGDAAADEDFVTFTTGVNMASKGDKLGQQYQTPSDAVVAGSDFLIAGRGIYKSSDPIAAARQYQKSSWEAYLARVSG